MNTIFKKGFTLIELLVTIAIISILSAILFVSFDDARKQARDKARVSELKEMQLALELYKAQNGHYPEQGCGVVGEFAGVGPGGTGLASCTTTPYITGLTPDFIATLPIDKKFQSEAGRGFYYRTNADRSSYKLMIHEAVESLTVTSYNDKFARCPRSYSTSHCGSTPPPDTYAVFSRGAEDW